MSDQTAAREMTRNELLTRIQELAAERDAAIDARLTAETECGSANGRISRLRSELEDERSRLVELAEQTRRWRVRAETLESERDTWKATVANANASVNERVANALMQRDQAAERMREREVYLLRRTAALLESTGYTTVERAAAEARRELAVVLAGGGS